MGEVGATANQEFALRPVLGAFREPPALPGVLTESTPGSERLIEGWPGSSGRRSPGIRTLCGLAFGSTKAAHAPISLWFYLARDVGVNVYLQLPLSTDDRQREQRLVLKIGK